MKAEYIDVPKEQILAMIEKSLKEQLKTSSIEDVKNFKVDRVEWTLEGIRVWTLKKT